MAIKQPIRHIIEDFLNNIFNTTYSVNSHSHVSGTTIIDIDNILHLRAGMIVNVNSANYTVVSVLGDTTFTITAPNTFTPVTVIIPKPYWYAGTPIAINNQISFTPPASQTPMLWLYEIINEKRNQDADNIIEREADIRLFFLDEADFPNWDKTTNSNEYYNKVIDGMDRLAEEFKEQMYNSKYFGKFESYNITPFAKFGVYTDNKGVQNSILNANLSGVELRINLPINKILNAC